MEVTEVKLKEALKKACNYQNYLTEEEFNSMPINKAQDSLILRLVEDLAVCP